MMNPWVALSGGGIPMQMPRLGLPRRDSAHPDHNYIDNDEGEDGTTDYYKRR